MINISLFNVMMINISLVYVYIMDICWVQAILLIVMAESNIRKDQSQLGAALKNTVSQLNRTSSHSVMQGVFTVCFSRCDQSLSSHFHSLVLLAKRSLVLLRLPFCYTGLQERGRVLSSELPTACLYLSKVSQILMAINYGCE